MELWARPNTLYVGFQLPGIAFQQKPQLNCCIGIRSFFFQQLPKHKRCAGVRRCYTVNKFKEYVEQLVGLKRVDFNSQD